MSIPDSEFRPHFQDISYRCPPSPRLPDGHIIDQATYVEGLRAQIPSQMWCTDHARYAQRVESLEEAQSLVPPV